METVSTVSLISWVAVNTTDPVVNIPGMDARGTDDTDA